MTTPIPDVLGEQSVGQLVHCECHRCDRRWDVPMTALAARCGLDCLTLAAIHRIVCQRCRAKPAIRRGTPPHGAPKIKEVMG